LRVEAKWRVKSENHLEIWEAQNMSRAREPLSRSERSKISSHAVVDTPDLIVLPGRFLRTARKHPPLRLCYLLVVDGSVPPGHSPVRGKLPHLIAIAAPPLAVRVARFVFKANSNPVSMEAPKFLAQTVVQFEAPFRRQKLANLLSSVHKGITVSPF
jgi:hypothetical protein